MSKNLHPVGAEEQQRIVEWLSRPDAYPERTAGVDHQETHISWVFLTDRFVYKLKKAVQFDFIDFSTPARREQACRDEVRLNRRLAPNTYRAVLPIHLQSDGALRLDGSGQVIDWVVQMERLPAEQMLDAMIRERRLHDADTRRLTEFLGRFYAAAQPLTMAPEKFRSRLLAHVRSNRHDLLSHAKAVDKSQVGRIHSTQLQLLFGNPALFDERTAAGLVIEGHGDLRPEHICLLDPPVVFDCIEFDADLRSVDVVDDLSFLAMECDRLGNRQLGTAAFSAYQELSGDLPAAELLAFYKSYRACIRAKVALVRATQLAVESRTSTIQEAQAYLDLADGYLQTTGARPLLVLVTGLSGTGKSTLARQLGGDLGIGVIRTDELRKKLMKQPGDPLAYGTGRYSLEARTKVYEHMIQSASDRLSRQESVILDGTFALRTIREKAVDCGRERGAKVVVVECVCPREVALARIRTRLEREVPDPSEALAEHYDLQRTEWEESPTTLAVRRIDTTEAVDDQLASVYRVVGSPFKAG